VSDITRMFGLRPGCATSLARDGCHYTFGPNGDLIDHEAIPLDAAEARLHPPRRPTDGAVADPNTVRPDTDDLPF
jgi:hypothetical protein